MSEIGTPIPEPQVPRDFGNKYIEVTVKVKYFPSRGGFAFDYEADRYLSPAELKELTIEQALERTKADFERNYLPVDSLLFACEEDPQVAFEIKEDK